MTVIKLEGKSIEDTIKKPLMNFTMWNRYPSIMVVIVTHLLAIMVEAAVEIQKYLVFILVFACGTDGHISRFCSQMQSLVDQGPDNKMLYPHSPPLLVNRDSHKQSMQASTHGHHVDKRYKPYTQPSDKSNRTVNMFKAYPEVTSDEDISSEEFTHKSPARLLMTAGQAKPDQLKQSWSRNRADEPHQYD